MSENPALSAPLADARLELLAAVRALHALPIQYIAWIRGVALRRHIGEATGISQARLANRHQKLRPSTERRARAHSSEAVRANLAQAGLSPEHVDLAQRRFDELDAAGGGTWAAFWAALDYPVEHELSTCTPDAIKFDKLARALVDAADTDDLEAGRAAAIEFLHGWNLPAEVIAAAAGPGLKLAEWSQVATWDDARNLSLVLLEVAFFDQFAHVDAVWGNAFFSRLAPRPVFSLVAPKRLPPKRVEIPVKRLLQLSFALNHWARYLKWPAKPPGPKELGEVLELEGEDVSRLFDGTTKLHYQQFEKRWNRFGKHFGLKHEVFFPAPVAAIAICWQHQFVTVSPTHKLASFIVLDEGYERLWRWRRAGIAAQSQGTEPWAAWLGD